MRFIVTKIRFLSDVEIIQAIKNSPTKKSKRFLS